MATYEYIARTAGGEQVAGVMQADSETAVVRTLDERKLFPVRVAPQAEKAGAARRGKRIRIRDVGVAYGQLADLLRAGVPMLRTLETQARAGSSRALNSIFLRVRDDVAGGQTLADAMSEHAAVFPELHVAMVRAGEKGGFLEEVLGNLSEYLERVDDLRSKVRGSMIYPAALTIIGILAMGLILVAVVPQFKPVFEGYSLPVPTQILFGLSDLLVEYLPLLIGLLILAVAGIRAAIRSRFGQELWDRYRLYLPLVGRPMRMVSITRFCRILGTLLANGVPILQSLAISKDATGCSTLAASINVAAENVRAGEPLAEPLKASGLFPEEVIEMIAVGEESNQLEKVLVRIADTVERRTTRQVDVAVRMLEPLILAALAVAIGFMAFGLYYPIFTMARSLR